MGSSDDGVPINDARYRSAKVRERLARLAADQRDPLFLPFDAVDLPTPSEDPNGEALTEVRNALMQVLSFADAAAANAGWPDGLVGTRAFHLLLALDRDLAALAEGAKAPALAPRSPTSARQTRSLHETISQFKDETAAAAELLFRWRSPREKVWSGIAKVVKAAGYPAWGVDSIKERYRELRDAGELEIHTNNLIVALLRGGRVDDGPIDWGPVVGPEPWDSRTAALKVEARLQFMASRAASILEALNQSRAPKT